MASPKLINTRKSPNVEIDLSTVDRIITNKNAGLIILPLPLADSMNTAVFDLIGMVKLIKIIGVFQGPETGAKNDGNLKDKRKQIEDLIVGSQLAPISFTSTKSGTLKVKIMDVTWTEVPGTPNVLNYELNLVESEDVTQ